MLINCSYNPNKVETVNYLAALKRFLDIHSKHETILILCNSNVEIGDPKIQTFCEVKIDFNIDIRFSHVPK